MEAKSERKSVEVHARNVEMAIEKGLAELGLRKEEAEIVVVKEGSRGVLGIGAEDAVVRISPLTPPSPPAAAAETRPTTETEPQKPQVEREPESELEPELEYPQKVEPEDIAKLAKIASSTLETLLAHMGIPAHVEVVEKPLQAARGAEDTITLNVTGDDLGILIGRRGETLDDLQFITRLIVSRQIQRWPNIIVDVEYYKARREKLLTDLARRMAEKVRLSHQPIALEPMSAHERRIIHLALRDFPGVLTESSGEGQKRKVVILPKP